jgi:hypothetical protein
MLGEADTEEEEEEEEGIEGESGSEEEENGDGDVEDSLVDAEIKIAEEKNIENTIDNTENDKNDNNKRILKEDCTDVQSDSKKVAISKVVNLE